jgi:hypothetical protein
VLFETLDREPGGGWIHKSFIQKAAESVVVPLDNNDTHGGQSQRLVR